MATGLYDVISTYCLDVELWVRGMPIARFIYDKDGKQEDRNISVFLDMGRTNTMSAPHSHVYFHFFEPVEMLETFDHFQ